ncbi:MAG: hypothetical protein ACKVOB_01260 [Sphingomonas sp.]
MAVLKGTGPAAGATPATINAPVIVQAARRKSRIGLVAISSSTIQMTLSERLAAIKVPLRTATPVAPGQLAWTNILARAFAPRFASCHPAGSPCIIFILYIIHIRDHSNPKRPPTFQC